MGGKEDGLSKAAELISPKSQPALFTLAHSCFAEETRILLVTTWAIASMTLFCGDRMSNFTERAV